MQQVLAAEQPIEDQIRAEKQANLAKAQAQMGFAKAAAAIMQQAAPAVQGAYSNAANADAGYARGLGNVAQGQLDTTQNADNSFLTKMGAPQGALHSAAPVGNLAYGTQGFIPATSLQREGAAWEGAAQLAPGDQLRAGQEQATSTLANDPTLVSLQNSLAKIAATQPSVYSGLLDHLVTQSQGQERINLSANRDAVLAEQGQQRINLEGQRLQVSIRQAAQRNAQAWARIGIESKRLKMSAAKAQAKLNTGGFTPDELVHIKNTAANMAQALHDGVPATSTKPAIPGRNYKYALNYLVARGIPVTIAMNELGRAGYHVPTGKGAGFLDNIGKDVAGLGAPLAMSGVAGKVVQLAHEYLGTQYVWGGESPKGFDCSGLAQYIYGKVGINIPRTTYAQWQTGRSVSKGALRPGDLVFFRGSDSRGGLPGHVGIYVGDGMMIDAPHTGSNVRVESVFNFGGYMGARRYGRA